MAPDEPLARDLPHTHDGEECSIAAMTRPAPSEKKSAGPDPLSLVLDRGQALLLVIDVQKKLAQAMPPKAMSAVARNVSVLLRAAGKLGLPIVASEQYPKGLGPTLPALAKLLPHQPLEKLEFSAGNNQGLAKAVLGARRRQVIIAGLEAHVCVFQTARDLALAGFHVFIPEDAVLSRTPANLRAGLRLCEKAGALVSSTEAILFDLLGAAGTPEFRALAPLIR